MQPIARSRTRAMPLYTLVLAAACAAASVNANAQTELSFNRVASFLVCTNSVEPPETECGPGESVAEIVAASEDGNALVYTDGARLKLGFVDISTPSRPRPLGTTDLAGEPTSVAVAGPYALVVVNTTEMLNSPTGYLAVYDIAACVAQPANCGEVVRIALEGQPDSVAVSPDGRYGAVVIENARNEDIDVDGVEGGLPQEPEGTLQVLDLAGAPDAWTLRSIDLSGLSEYAPGDPEPEYVDISYVNVAAVTLQENNHVVLVYLPSGRILSDFPAGSVDLDGIDVEDDSLITLDASLEDVPREPDAVTWLGASRLATANEGDLFGGSRGFSVFDFRGRLVYDSGVELEHLAVEHGHYPEGRSDNKGAEPEGIESGVYLGQRYIFVGAKRANFVAVYRDEGRREPPVLTQFLPTGLGPEGLLAIPDRNLFVVASEVDEDVRSTISIYQLSRRPPAYPTVVSDARADEPAAGLPIPWGALSGLAASADDPDKLYAVHDGFYRSSRIFELDVSGRPARITGEIVLSRNGAPVDYDLEGIDVAPGGGFWLVSEGSGSVDDAARPVESLNLLIRASANGEVLEEIELPGEVNDRQRRFGLKGVAVRGEGQDERVYVAFQREWAGDPEGFVRIGRHDPGSGEWAFYLYPLETVDRGWVGLSEIVHLGDGRFAVIERDNQAGPDAAVKRVYRFSVSGLRPQPEGSLTPFPRLRKALATNVLPRMGRFRGWVPDKLEGLTVAADGQVYAVTGNDGVDGATGETLFMRLGQKSWAGF